MANNLTLKDEKLPDAGCVLKTEEAGEGQFAIPIIVAIKRKKIGAAS